MLECAGGGPFAALSLWHKKEAHTSQHSWMSLSHSCDSCVNSREKCSLINVERNSRKASFRQVDACLGSSKALRRVMCWKVAEEIFHHWIIGCTLEGAGQSAVWKHPLEPINTAQISPFSENISPSRFDTFEQSHVLAWTQIKLSPRSSMNEWRKLSWFVSHRQLSLAGRCRF